jgi:hypothetical protein
VEDGCVVDPGSEVVNYDLGLIYLVLLQAIQLLEVKQVVHGEGIDDGILH